MKEGSLTSVREALQKAYEVSGVMPPKLDVPPPPREAVYVYEMYEHVRSGESAGVMGVERLTWCTLEAWSRLYGYELAVWELDLLRRMDNCYLTVRAEAK